MKFVMKCITSMWSNQEGKGEVLKRGILHMAADCKDTDQSKHWLKIRRDVCNGCAQTELFCKAWMLLGSKRQPTDRGENNPFHLYFLSLSGKATSLQNEIKTTILDKEKLKEPL